MSVLSLFLYCARPFALQPEELSCGTRTGDLDVDTDPKVALGRRKTVLLTTFRADGRPVGTPVHVAMDRGRAYFRTYDAAWKVKRIRRTPEVEVAPSTMRGSITGPAFRAKVREVHGEEAVRAARALARKYPLIHGFLVPWTHRLKGYRTLHFEIIPIGERAWKVP